MNICVSAVFQLLLLTLSRGEKKCELATFFCGCLLGWLLSKAAVSKKDELCVWGETGKTTVFSCCKTAVDKAGVCMDVNCMYK
jgi:hypothetical protein